MAPRSAQRSAPSWLRAVGVLLGVQAVTAVVMTLAARSTMATLQGDLVSLSYLDFGARWDAAWYARIVADGYPGELPVDAAGTVVQNTWAFYPLFPLLARAAGAFVGWPLGGWLVAEAATVGAAIALHRLVERQIAPAAATWTVALLAAAPAASVLQQPYSESLGLLLALGTLLALFAHRHVTAAGLLLLIGVARPIAAPLAVVVVLHLAVDLTRPGARRRPDAGQLLLLAACPVAVLAWPVIAAAVTGRIDAYPASMSAWRGGRRVALFTPWRSFADHHLGAPWGTLALIAAAGVFAVLVARAGRLPVELRVWCIAYVGYLLAVLDPSTSVVRYGLLLFPLAAWAVAVTDPYRGWRRAVPWALLVTGLAGQVVWIVSLWRLILNPP